MDQKMNNPYPSNSPLNRIFDVLARKDKPMKITDLASAIGSSYNTAHKAILGDPLGAIELTDIDGVRAAKACPDRAKQPDDGYDEHMIISTLLEGWSTGLTVKQISDESGASRVTVRRFLKDHSSLGNIELNPARGKEGHRYKWIGPAPHQPIETKLTQAEPKEVESAEVDALEIALEKAMTKQTSKEPAMQPTTYIVIDRASKAFELTDCSNKARDIAEEWAADSDGDVFIAEINHPKLVKVILSEEPASLSQLLGA